MKKLLITIITMSIWGSMCTLQAQTEDKQYPYKNSLRISPFQFANSAFQLNYERYFNDRRSSILLSPALLLRENGNESLLGFKGLVQYRFYLSHLKKGINKTWGFYNVGFYFGGYSQFIYANEEYFGAYYNNNNGEYYEGIYEKDVVSIEGGVMTGIQIDIFPRLIVDVFVGGGVKYADITDEIEKYVPETNIYRETYGVLDREYTGVNPKGGFQIGFNF